MAEGEFVRDRDADYFIVPPQPLGPLQPDLSAAAGVGAAGGVTTGAGAPAFLAVADAGFDGVALAAGVVVGFSTMGAGATTATGTTTTGAGGAIGATAGGGVTCVGVTTVAAPVACAAGVAPLRSQPASAAAIEPASAALSKTDLFMEVGGAYCLCRPSPLFMARCVAGSP